MVLHDTIAFLNKQNHSSATKFEEPDITLRFTVRCDVKSITQTLESWLSNC
jgi:hypothetical protein